LATIVSKHFCIAWHSIYKISITIVLVIVLGIIRQGGDPVDITLLTQEDNNINIKEASAIYGSYGLYFEYVSGSNSYVAKVWNTIVYDITKSGAYGVRTNDADWTLHCHNVTVHNCDTGYYNSNGTFNAKNCGAAACTTGFAGTSAITQTTCSTTTPTFVDESGDDFHLASGDTTWQDQGTDLSGDGNLAFSDDIDGETRSGSWDIGADEYAAAGGLTLSTSDTITITENVSGSLATVRLKANVSDVITVAENVSNSLTTVRLKIDVSDSISIAEFTKEPITPLVARLNEAITVLENLKAVISPTTISGAEAITVIENAVASLSTVRLNISVSDAISIAENVTATLSGISDLAASLNEALSITESVTASLATIRYSVSVNEAVTVLENLTAQLIYVLYKISVADSITVSENVAISLSGGFTALPYNIMSYSVDPEISKSIGFQGNILPISITTGTPTAAPPGDKGVVFKVLGGTVTIYVWDGSAWRTK